MPELIEVEYYRNALEPIIGQQLRSVVITPESFLAPPGTPVSIFDCLIGATLLSTRRVGKLLILELVDQGKSMREVGLRFGMTGRLLVDGKSPIDRLEYSSDRNDVAWDRAVLQFEGTVSIRDQRRLGSIEVDPDIGRLGPDATALDAAALARIVHGRTKTVKAILLDQALVAGLGNLLCDEVLWRSCLAPTRPGCSLTSREIVALEEQIHTVITELTKRGGSHRGDSFELRESGAICPMCGATMRRETVATRSTWWCSGHQR